MKGKVRKIDMSYERLGKMADGYYNEGKYVSALRFAYKQLDLYGGDGDVYTRLADIYENMGLHVSAVNCLYRFLDDCEEEDLPDLYESLAVNYLNMGNEHQSAYYYNQLINVDDTLPEETKYEIAETFSTKKKDNFRVVYPPEKADYSKELEEGALALKHGNCDRAIHELSKVAKGSLDYARAQEMQAIAYLLSGRAKTAEEICAALLKEEPDNVQAASTLAAAYLEQDKTEESRALAEQLAKGKQKTSEETFKVATVCCENGLHEAAYNKFLELENDMPYDGRMLYFKGVAATKCGKRKEAIECFDRLCTIYPDAVVARFYLERISEKEESLSEEATTYFYRLPDQEREKRVKALTHIGKASKDEAELLGELAEKEGYFRWAFDELDGADHDLQYLALTVAVHASCFDFVCDVMLDCEVSDVLKIETLRMLLERNENSEIGMVLCHIYRNVMLDRIEIGRKKRKRFIEGYAKIASKFIAINDRYAKRIKLAAEKLYREVEGLGFTDLFDNSNDVACAIYFVSKLKELGGDLEQIAGAFEADPDKVNAMVEFCEGGIQRETTMTKEEKKI